MPEEPDSQPLAVVRPLYDSRNVGHNERLVVIVAHHSDARLQCCERIVGDFRLCRRHCRKQRGFTGIREAYKSHIRKQLQLKDIPALGTEFPRLSIPWCLIGRTLEVGVAQSSAPAFDEHIFLSRLHHLVQNLARLRVLSHSPERHVQIDVLSSLAVAKCPASGLSVLRAYMFLILKMNQCPELRICPQNDIPSASSVPSVRPSLRHIFLPPQMHRPRAPVSRSAENLDVVYEIAVCHSLFYQPQR